VTYQPPAIETRQSIEHAFVLGSNYPTPSWTEKDSEDNA
jgi:hypothetical protein